MVSMLDRLEREGLIVRIPSASDRRIKLIGLTETGKQLCTEVQKAGQEFRHSLLDGMDPQALAIATELLETLQKRIEERL